MSWFFHHLILLFITLNVVNASRWWRDTGYDDLIGDSPEPFATHPPKSTYQKSLDASTPPLNATTGTGIYHLFAARQLAGCRLCSGSTPTCCNNGTFCCGVEETCQDAGWCCTTGHIACPGAANVCRSGSQICCGDGVCPEGSTCCGTSCCRSGYTCTRDRQCLNPDDQASISSVSVLSVLSVQSVASVGAQTTSQPQSTSQPATSSSSSSPVGEEPSTSDPPSSSESSTSVIVAETPPAESPTTVSDAPSSSASDPVTPSVTSVSDSASDPITIVPFVATLSVDFGSSSSSVELPSDPPSDSITPSDPPSDSITEPSISDDPAPTDTFIPADSFSSAAADALPSSSNIVLDTTTSNGVVLTNSRTVAPHVLTATTTKGAANTELAEVDGSDAVATVQPWDPRIVYTPDGAWTATSSESTVGTCHNGTRVATIAGATITFPFEGKQIAALICNGSKGGDYSMQVDGSPAVNLNGYKDPGTTGDQCILAQTFNSGPLADGSHTITVIVKGSNAVSANAGTAVEFGGFIYRGPHAYGTDTGSKPNIPAIVGGTVGGVVGGILILTLIVVICIRRRRNRRVDNAPAVHTIPATPGIPYSTVPTAEYHDPYATSGYGPGYYPNPTASSSPQPPPVPAWRQTDQGPFGQGSYVAGR